MIGLRRTPLEEVARVLGGGTPSRQEAKFFGGPIPWATPTDVTALDGMYINATRESITDEGLRCSSTKLLPAGAVLLTSRATIGFTAVASAPICTNQGFVNFICGPDLIPEFLAYWLRTQKAKMLQHAGGTTFKEIARGTLRRFEITLPSTDEQRPIVDRLARAEGIVRLRREAQQKAAELIPAIFIDMFGDPATNPKGWPVVPMSELVGEFRYGTSQKSGPVGAPVLRIPNVVDGAMDLTEVKFVALTSAEHERLRLVDGDLLFVRTNGNPDFVGRCSVYDSKVLRTAGFDGAECVYASYLIRARLADSRVSPTYLQAYLSSRRGRQLLRERAKTSAGQFNLNIDGLGSLPVPVPPQALQRRFIGRVGCVARIASQHRSAKSAADALFGSLLAKAFGADR